MKKYFNNEEVENIESEKVLHALRSADKHPKKHIRIAINDEIRKINFKNEEECEIEQALVFIWAKDSIFRYDFTPDTPDHSFHAAVLPQEYIAVSLDADGDNLEGLCTSKGNDAFFGMFKTETATFFIVCDGSQKDVGYGYYMEEGCASIFERLFSLFEHMDLDTEQEPFWMREFIVRPNTDDKE